MMVLLCNLGETVKFENDGILINEDSAIAMGNYFVQIIVEKQLRLNTHLDTNKEDLICSLIFTIHPSLSALSLALI